MNQSKLEWIMTVLICLALIVPYIFAYGLDMLTTLPLFVKFTLAVLSAIIIVSIGVVYLLIFAEDSSDG